MQQIDGAVYDYKHINHAWSIFGALLYGALQMLHTYLLSEIHLN